MPLAMRLDDDDLIGVFFCHFNFAPVFCHGALARHQYEQFEYLGRCRLQTHQSSRATGVGAHMFQKSRK